jgi:hypothetical protein
VKEVTELNETRANREISTEPNNEHDQYFSREEVVDDFKHWCFLAFLEGAHYTGARYWSLYSVYCKPA